MTAKTVAIAAMWCVFCHRSQVAHRLAMLRKFVHRHVCVLERSFATGVIEELWLTDDYKIIFQKLNLST